MISQDEARKIVDKALSLATADETEIFLGGGASGDTRFAVNTATTILRVDTIIMAKPAGGPKMPKQEEHWDDAD